MGLRGVSELPEPICLLIRQRVVKGEEIPIPTFPSVMRLLSVLGGWQAEEAPLEVGMAAQVELWISTVARQSRTLFAITMMQLQGTQDRTVLELQAGD